MSPSSNIRGASKRWVFAFSVLAVLLLLGFSLVLRTPDTPPEVRRNPKAASVALTSLEENPSAGSALQAVREEALLRDPTPLFHPTPLNSAQSVRPESMLREPGDSFAGFEPRSFFDSGALSLRLPDPVSLPSGPAADLVRVQSDHPFLGLGSVDPEPLHLRERKVHLEIYAADQGNLMMAVDVEDIPLPGGLDWAPCELVARTDAAGLVGLPPVVTSSRSEQVDRLVHEYLEKHWVTFERRAKLPPGAYRILVGP